MDIDTKMKQAQEILSTKGDAVEEVKKILDSLDSTTLDHKIEVMGMNGTLLHWACNYGCTNVAKYLLNCRADMDVKFEGYTDGELTPLELVKKKDHEELIDVLSYFYDQIQLEKKGKLKAENNKNNFNALFSREGKLQFSVEDVDSEEEGNTPKQLAKVRSLQHELSRSSSLPVKKRNELGDKFKRSNPMNIKRNTSLNPRKLASSTSPLSTSPNTPKAEIPDPIEADEEFNNLKDLQDTVATYLTFIVELLQTNLGSKDGVKDIKNAESVLLAVAELKQIRDVMSGHIPVDILNLLPDPDEANAPAENTTESLPQN